MAFSEGAGGLFDTPVSTSWHRQHAVTWKTCLPRTGSPLVPCRSPGPFELPIKTESKSTAQATPLRFNNFIPYLQLRAQMVNEITSQYSLSW